MAIFARAEGEFTMLEQIQGNDLLLAGIDDDPAWKYRSARFLKPLYADKLFIIKFLISVACYITLTFSPKSIPKCKI